MIELTTNQDFPAGLDRLWTTFGRPEYPREKYLSLGATEVHLRSFRASSRSIDVELDRDVPVEAKRLPPWARAFASGRQVLHHATRWRRVSPTRVAGELEITPLGLPVRADAVGAIVQTTAVTSRMSLNWRVSASLPIVGRAIEHLFADQLRDALDADHAFTVGYLQRRAGSGAAARHGTADRRGFPRTL